MDTYCVATESGANHYGGIASWRLGDGALVVRLAPEAAGSLGIAGFSIEVAESDEATVRAGLSRVLDGPT